MGLGWPDFFIFSWVFKIWNLSGFFKYWQIILTSVKDFMCQTKHFCGLCSLEAVGSQPLNEIDSSGPGYLEFRVQALPPAPQKHLLSARHFLSPRGAGEFSKGKCCSQPQILIIPLGRWGLEFYNGFWEKGGRRKERERGRKGQRGGIKERKKKSAFIEYLWDVGTAC